MLLLRCITRRVYSARLPSVRHYSVRYFVHKVHCFIGRNLFFVNVFTSGGFMYLGDLVQQEIEYQAGHMPERYDTPRLTRMFICGSLIGPLHHWYYVALDRWVPGCALRDVVIKILGDQLFAAPLTILSIFYIMGALEKKSFEKCNEEIKKKALYVYMGDCLFWPPIQFINFYYLPGRYRVIYINLATMVFNVFISYMKHYDHDYSTDEKKDQIDYKR